MRSSLLHFARRFFLGIGVAMLIYAGGTVAYASIYQRYQSRKLDKTVTAARLVKPSIVEETLDFDDGQVIGKLLIPRIGISVVVLQGVEESTLILGAGHVPGTPLPGGEGNVAIAGHRDTFFRKLEGILPGDRIQFANPQRSYEYVVDGSEIVPPEDTQPMESRARQELTLITCFPFYFVGSAPNRFIVHAHPI